jgi:hypothetical protein
MRAGSVTGLAYQTDQLCLLHPLAFPNTYATKMTVTALVPVVMAYIHGFPEAVLPTCKSDDASGDRPD